MHAVTFLQDLAVVMIVAGLVTVLCHRLKQPVVLGYIIAGVIIGPHTPPFPLITDAEIIQTLAELGVVFLMFSLGLDFSLRKLRQVGATALIAATLEILLMVCVGYEIGRLFGWSTMDSIFLGAMLSISSTTIIVKALAELGQTKERFAELIFGILILEDILAIVMIALLSGIAMTGSLSPMDVVATAARLGVFLVVALVLGLLAVPRLLHYVAAFRSNEMLLITVLGLCFGVSLLAVALGYSVALGAFVIGAVVAEAREIGTIERLTEPLRDMFSAVFFVAIGLLIQPALLVEYAWPITVITVAVVAGKVIACSFGTVVAGHDPRVALRVGMGLAQIGEFSFIIAALGDTLHVTSAFLYPIAVTVSAITTLLTPYLLSHAERVGHWSERHAPRAVASLTLYSHWVARLGEGKQRSITRRYLRGTAGQLAINIALIAAVFIAATFGAARPLPWLPMIPDELGGVKALLWLAAMLVSLPLCIVTLRKLHAVGLFVSQMSVPDGAAGPRTAAVRAIVASTILVAGSLGFALVILLFSAALLPPRDILVVLLVFLAAITVLLWRSFSHLYARAQGALQDAFAQSPAPHPHTAARSLPALLSEAELETVVLHATSPAIGKRLRDLALRASTGASAVGIERDGTAIINPGADQDLRAGDQVLLLGNPAQLEAARAYLTGH